MRWFFACDGCETKDLLFSARLMSAGCSRLYLNHKLVNTYKRILVAAGKYINRSRVVLRSFTLCYAYLDFVYVMFISNNHKYNSADGKMVRYNILFHRLP